MTLNEQSKRFLQIIEAQNRPGWQEIPIDQSRRLFASFESAFGVGPELHSVADRQISKIPIRIYRPTDEANQACIMYFHGGGWVLGNLDTHDACCRHLSKQSGCTVVAVDYRLAPEHRYPAAFEDCYDATQYVFNHPDEFGINPQQLMVAGDSAGGNLAGAVSIKARDEANENTTPNIQLQILIYPVVEANFTTDSYHQFANGYGLTAETMQWMWKQYWDEGIQSDDKYVRLTMNALHDLPRTYILTAEYDVLRDEGETFAKQLEDAGVDVSLVRYPGVLHGFVHFSGIFEDGLKAIEDIAKVVHRS